MVERQRRGGVASSGSADAERLGPVRHARRALLDLMTFTNIGLRQASARKNSARQKSTGGRPLRVRHRIFQILVDDKSHSCVAVVNVTGLRQPSSCTCLTLRYPYLGYGRICQSTQRQI
jgi:hypothetical protein